MLSTEFKTEPRWWFWISIVLFVVPWFLPVWDVKGETMIPASIFVILLEYPNRGETLLHIIIWCLLFGAPAVCLGWVLQCVAVMVRDAGQKRGEDDR